jgi:hypothetical protein
LPETELCNNEEVEETKSSSCSEQLFDESSSGPNESPQKKRTKLQSVLFEESFLTAVISFI